jgi:hypothetical protein
MKFQFPEGKRLISLAYKIDKKYMQPRASHGTHYQILYDGTFSKPHFSNSVFE